MAAGGWRLEVGELKIDVGSAQDWHVLQKMSKDWRIGELVKNCRNGRRLVRDWQLIVQN